MINYLIKIIYYTIEIKTKIYFYFSHRQQFSFAYFDIKFMNIVHKLAFTVYISELLKIIQEKVSKRYWSVVNKSDVKRMSSRHQYD